VRRREMPWTLTRFGVIGLFGVTLILTAAAIASAQDKTFQPEVYEVTLKKVEFSTDNGATYVTLVEKDLTFNIAAANAGALVGNYVTGAGLPLGTYNRMRITVSCSMRLKAETQNLNITYRTTDAGTTCADPPGPCGATAGTAKFTAPAAICPTGNFTGQSPPGVIQFTVQEGKSVTALVDFNTANAAALFIPNIFPGAINADMTIQ
jgi:hypothetical protein